MNTTSLRRQCRNPYCQKFLVQREDETNSNFAMRNSCGFDCSRQAGNSHRSRKLHQSVIGKQYGEVIITNKWRWSTYRRNKRRRLVKIVDSCGNSNYSELSRIVRGQVLSIKNVGQGFFTGKRLANTRCTARNRYGDFPYSNEELWSMIEAQSRKSAYTGLPLDADNASLDRIDSSVKTYQDNCWWVTWEENGMKGGLDHERFVYLCNLIAKNHPRDV